MPTGSESWVGGESQAPKRGFLETPPFEWLMIASGICFTYSATSSGIDGGAALLGLVKSVQSIHLHARHHHHLLNLFGWFYVDSGERLVGLEG